MRAGLTWLLSFALLPLAGASLLSHPAFRPIGFAARAVLSAACGAAILSTVATLSSLAGIPWSPLGLLVVSAGAAFAFRWALGHQTAAEELPPGLPLRSRVFWGALSAIVVAAALDVTAVGGATSVDMILQWGFKAQAFAAARGFDAALLGNSANDVNRAYPPLVPTVEAFATMLSGRFPWGAATLVFPLLLVLLALSLPRLLARGGRCDLAFAGATLAVAVMAYAGVRHEIAGNGDMPLWFFEALAAVVLSVPLGGERATCVLGGLLLAGATTTKIEGLAFSAAAIAFFVAPRWRRRRLRLADLLFLVAPAILSIGAWFAFGISRRIFSGYGMGPLFGIRWERTGEVLGAVAHELGKAPWPYLAALLFLAACGATRRPAALPIGVAGLLSVFLLFTYLHGTLDPREWIAWSAARVFAPLSMLLILAGAAGSDRPPAATPRDGAARA